MPERCGWVSDDQLYQRYHDDEWGVPERDPRALWELLMLEGFQAGLSWITILRKRENFRAAFKGFDPNTIATWGEDEVAALLQDAGIIRHRGKIEGVIKSAQAWQKIEAREGFVPFIWAYVDDKPLQPARADLGQVPSKTDISERMSKDLKREGFKFCGPTITYAFMQAAGLVNDHVVTCHSHAGLR